MCSKDEGRCYGLFVVIVNFIVLSPHQPHQPSMDRDHTRNELKYYWYLCVEWNTKWERSLISKNKILMIKTHTR